MGAAEEAAISAIAAAADARDWALRLRDRARRRASSAGESAQFRWFRAVLAAEAAGNAAKNVWVLASRPRTVLGADSDAWTEYWIEEGDDKPRRVGSREELIEQLVRRPGAQGKQRTSVQLYGYERPVKLRRGEVGETALRVMARQRDRERQQRLDRAERLRAELSSELTERPE